MASIDNENFCGDRRAECEALTAIFSRPAEWTEQLLAQLLPEHFYWADTEALFSEVQRMRGAGVSLTDADAAGHTAVIAMVVGLGAELPSRERIDELISELQRWRIARGVRRVAAEAAARLDAEPAEPLAVIKWATAQLGRLQELANGLPTAG